MNYKNYRCHECIYWIGRLHGHNDLDGKCHRYPTLLNKNGSERSCGELVPEKTEDLINRIKNNPTLNDAYKKMRSSEDEFRVLEILSRENFKND